MNTASLWSRTLYRVLALVNGNNSNSTCFFTRFEILEARNFSLPFYYLLWRLNRYAGDTCIKGVVSHFLCKSSTNTCVSPPSCHWGSNPGLVILYWKMLSKFAYRCRIFYVATCHRNRTEWHAASPSPSYCMKYVMHVVLVITSFFFQEKAQ